MDYAGGPDVEYLLYEDMDSELSDEDERSERIAIPGGKSDAYGGDSCQCCCHDSEEQPYASRTKHCVPCGLKFIAGKVYLQTENGLRPIRVNFSGGSTYNSNLKRLNPDPRKIQRSRGTKRGRSHAGRSGGTSSKDNSPIKGAGKLNAQDDKKASLETEEELSATKSKSPRSHRERSKSIPSRSKDKQTTVSTPSEQPATARATQQGNRSAARSRVATKGKTKLCLSPPPVTYDEMALPAPEPTAAKSDATDFSVLVDVLRQERRGQEVTKLDEDPVKDVETFPVGSDDSAGPGAATDSAGAPDPDSADVDVGSHVGDVDAISDSDGSEVAADGDPDADSDEAMSVDSFGESEGDGESEGEGEGEVEVEDDGEGDKSDSREAEDGSSEEDSRDSQSGPSQAWTREEDRIILQSFQAEPNVSKTFIKIRQALPSRSLGEIKQRFDVLLKLIQQLT